MNVANLQKLLNNHADFLADAGAAAKIVNDFRAVAGGLSPFADMKLDELFSLLTQANEYRVTGVLPVKASKKPAKAPSASAEEKINIAVTSLREWFDRATTHDFTFDALDEVLAPIAKLTVPQLKEVARGIEIANVPTKKADIVAALRGKIEERREMHLRSFVEGQPDHGHQ